MSTRSRTDRREFLGATLAMTAALTSGRRAWSRTEEEPVAFEPAKRLRVLILGGTGFLGPWQVDALRRRGHEITLFNRGKTRPDLFPDLEKLRGDRDPDKGDGLQALKGREWDVVLDNSAYFPRHVRASAELLKDRVGLYEIVSSISVYADNSKEGADEDATLATMPDPTLESMGENYEYYGALKALCEQEARRAMPGRVTVVRPGYIVGPGDSSHRFTYWPLRVRKGGEVAVPGDPGDPIQVIDVRDLADWMVLCAESNTTGVYNACGPEERLTMREVVETCRTVTSSDATFTWLPLDLVREHGLRFPIWAPYEGETRGFHTWSNARAIAKGLVFRPLSDTVKDLLRWFDEDLPEEVREQVLKRIDNPKERDALAALEERGA